jgi:transposase-like protein
MTPVAQSAGADKEPTLVGSGANSEASGLSGSRGGVVSTLSSFKELFAGRHFEREVIILCVLWYLRYKLSFRDQVEMMSERGLNLAHTTILRWVRRYTPEFARCWNRFGRTAGRSWRVDETYIKVRGHWSYLYRAVDKAGQTIDFRLSRTRDVAAAKAFFKKAIRHERRSLHTITLDGHAASHRAVREMRTDGLLPKRTVVRSSKYLNNLIEQDHRGVKSRTRPMLGFKNFDSAAITIAGGRTAPPYPQRSILLESTAAQRSSCARDLECRACRVKSRRSPSPRTI